MLEYYDRRAPTYDTIYERDDPVRRSELGLVASALETRVRGHRVLDVACGTGYWTRRAATAACSIVGVDASTSMLEVFRSHGLPPNVTLCVGNAYALDAVEGTFTCGVATFWHSHVPRLRIAEFFDGFHQKLGPGARVFLVENTLVPGVGGELERGAGGDDSYKIRELPDGSRHRIVKNYYTPKELRALLEPRAEGLELRWMQCFYTVTYVTTGA